MLLAPSSRPTDQLLGVPVVEGPVPELADAPWEFSGMRGDERRARFAWRRTAILVEDGSRIVVDAPDPAERLTLDYFVYSFGLRLLLTQQRRFSLHASLVVDPQGRTVAVAGESMAGKSTTTTALALAGWSYVVDDVVELELREGRAWAVPHYRPVHLSDRAARALGADPALGRELPGRAKRVYRLPGDLTPRPLAAIVVLRCRDDVSEPGVSSRVLDPFEALPMVDEVSSVRGLCHLPGLRRDHFAWVSRVVSTVPVVEVVRPLGEDTVPQVVAAVTAAVG